MINANQAVMGRLAHALSYNDIIFLPFVDGGKYLNFIIHYGKKDWNYHHT